MYFRSLSEVIKDFLDGKELSSDDISVLVYDMDGEDINGDEHRWCKDVKSIREIEKGKYIAIDWRKDLTEYQENEFPSQPYYVKPRQCTTIVTIWEPADAWEGIEW